MEFRIGVLVPNSSLMPRLAQQVLAALKYGCHGRRTEKIEWVVVTSGHNASPREVQAKLQQLCVVEQVDCIVTVLNVLLVEHIQNVVVGQQVPILVLTAGEHALPNICRSQYLFLNSLQLWKSSWLLGWWAAETFGGRSAVMSGYHESGFGFGFANGLGTEAGGGMLCQTLPVANASTAQTFSDAFQEVSAIAPTHVFGGFSSTESKLFLEAYAGSSDYQFPLIGLDPLVQCYMPTNTVGMHSLPVTTVTSWSRNTELDQALATVLRCETPMQVHFYAMLAYEAGLFIAQALDSSTTDSPTGTEFLLALQESEIVGPRGTLRFETDIQQTDPAQYVRQCELDLQMNTCQQTLMPLVVPDLYAEQVALARQNVVPSGWTNPYLVA